MEVVERGLPESGVVGGAPVNVIVRSVEEEGLMGGERKRERESVVDETFCVTNCVLMVSRPFVHDELTTLPKGHMADSGCNNGLG